MTTRIFSGSARCSLRLTIAVFVGIWVMLPGSAGEVSAQGQTLTGVWATTITPRNCATNEPLPAFAFRALHTFHRDGTVTESVGTLAFAPGQRSIGHGNWVHGGARTFDERTVAMILFAGGMYQAGWQLTTRTVTLTDANHYTGSGSSQFFDLNGQLYFTGCATSVGVRLE